jgi:hypothetical protein
LLFRPALVQLRAAAWAYAAAAAVVLLQLVLVVRFQDLAHRLLRALRTDRQPDPGADFLALPRKSSILVCAWPAFAYLVATLA